MAKMPSTLGELAVPRSNRGMASVNVQPVIQARHDAAGYTKAGFDSLSQGLKAVDKALYNRQLENEERELKMLDVEFSKQRRLINQQFRTTQGEATLKARGGLDKSFAQAQEQLLKKASSTRVKQAFTLLAKAKTEGELEQADVYTENQRRAANEAASLAVMEETFQSAAENWGSATAMALAEKTVLQEVQSQARSNGWSPEVTKNKSQAAVSQLVKMQVLAAAETNPDMALSIYEGAKDKVDGDVRIELERHLSSVTIDAIAQAGAEEALSLYPGSITKQRAYIREKWSGKKEEAMIDQLDKRLAEGRSEMSWAMQLENHAYTVLNRQRIQDEKAEKEAIDVAGDSLYEALRGGQTRNEWEKANPEAAEWLLKDSYRSETLDRAATRIEVGRQYADVTVSAAKTKYNGMSTEELARVSDAQLELEKANFSLRDHDKLITQVTGARAKLENASGARSGIYDEATTMINRMAPRNKKGKLDITQAQFDSVERELHAWVDRQLKDGVIPKHEALRKEAQRLTIKVKSDPGSLFDWLSSDEEKSWDNVVAEMRNMSAPQRAAATVERADIPANIMEDLKAIMKANGLEDTGDLLERMAAAYALDDRARMQELISGAK